MVFLLGLFPPISSVCGESPESRRAPFPGRGASVVIKPGEGGKKHLVLALYISTFLGIIKKQKLLILTTFGFIEWFFKKFFGSSAEKIRIKVEQGAIMPRIFDNIDGTTGRTKETFHSSRRGNAAHFSDV